MSAASPTIRNAVLADADGIARVHVDTWRTAYAGIMPRQMLDELTYESRAERHRKMLSDPDACRRWFVAEDARAGIVGFACGWRSRDADPRFDAELYAIYVDAAFQKHGLGRALTGRLAAELVAQGYRAMSVWVLRDNGARRFYEAIGGRLTGHEKSEDFGGQTLVEVAYGWDDLAGLSRALLGRVLGGV